ncbi:aldolase/citrate lyase family protein [Paenirhodobacter sp.]|uniref:aldolase/citrate lyase family protein n=1 Tax=Paenirhodobacter sp. TaxID=1965326 RepID=UPI003B3D71C6
MVNSAAVAATRYPPRGISGLTRGTGFGRIADYAARAEDARCLPVQIETRAAPDRIEEIAAVEGVDGILARHSETLLKGFRTCPPRQTVGESQPSRATVAVSSRRKRPMVYSAKLES